MPIKLLISLVTTFILLAVPASFAVTPKNTKKLAIESFTKRPIARGVKLSPDGEHITIILKHQGQDKLAIMSLKTMTNVGLFQAKGEKRAIGNVYWVNNERIIYTIKKRLIGRSNKSENGEVFGVNIDGSKHRPIFGRSAAKPSYGHNEIIDLLPNDDKKILLSFYPWRSAGSYWLLNHKAKPILYKLDIYSGKKSRLGRLPIPYADALSDHAGNIRFAIGEVENQTVIYHRLTNTADWQQWDVPQHDDHTFIPYAFDKSNQQVYLITRLNRGTEVLYRYHLANKTLTKLYQHPQVDISKFIYSADKTQIVAANTDLGLPDYHYLEPNEPIAKLHRRLRESFEGSDIHITSTSADGSKAIFFQHSDTDPGSYYLYDLAKDQAKYILSDRQWIDPKLMAKTEAITVKASDGLTLHGYLTTPQEQNTNLPIVVLPHGGPHGVRDYWGFDWRVQLLANQGYGVLQINYRGSSGYGQTFAEQGYKKWGTAMIKDINDATKAMIKRGIADKNKICIFGGSYGAYAAMMATIREQSLYQCVIGSSGVYDLPLMVKDSDISDNDNGKAYFDKVLNRDISWLRNNSPSYNTDKIKAAVLLFHGTTDDRTPINQAEALTDALDRAKKPYLYYPIGQEGHGYYDEENRLFVYQKIIDFLAKHLK